MAGRHRRPTEARPARGRWLAIVGAVVVVVALAVVLPLVLLGGGDGSTAASDNPTTRPPASPSTVTTPPTTAPTTTSAAATTTSAPATTKATTKPPTHAAPPAPTLVVRADRAASWLIVTDARGRARFNALVPRGTTERFDGPFFHVVIGYPPGVLVIVNGKPQPRGGAGHVLRFDVRGS